MACESLTVRANEGGDGCDGGACDAEHDGSAVATAKCRWSGDDAGHEGEVVAAEKRRQHVPYENQPAAALWKRKWCCDC